MRADEFTKLPKRLPKKTLVEAPQPIAIEVKYGTWTIKAANKPGVDGKYKALATNARGERTEFMYASTQPGVIELIKAHLDSKGKGEANYAGSWNKATVDFNIEMTKDYFEPYHPSGASFEKDGGEVFLVLASPNYTDALGADAWGTKPSQFSKLHDRKESGQSSLKCITISKSRLQQLGLALGRFSVVEDHTDSDGNIYLKCVFEGEVHGSGDKMRLRAPGFTLAPGGSK